MNNWRSDYWDPARWRLPAVVRRCRTWVRATRRRRWTATVLLGVFVLFVCPGLLGTAAAAAAETGTRSAGSSVGSALGWTHVTDSSGADGGADTGPQRDFVTDYMATPTEAKIKQLQRLANGDLTAATGTLNGIDQVDAARMMQPEVARV